MKVEIGESLCYSYLRHVKQCWLVQSNWKVSEHWDRLLSDSTLESDFASMKRLFDPEGRVFGKTTGANQLLKQGEVDILGIAQDGSVHAVDVAFHKDGLNYGGGADNRVLKKLLRTMMILRAYQPANTKLHIYFLSPKVRRAMQQPLESVFARLEAQYPKIDWHLLTNNSFSEQVVQATLEKTASVEDTSELFARAAKLLDLSGLYWSKLAIPRPVSSISRQEKVSISKPQTRLPHMSRRERIQECIEILTHAGYDRTEPSHDPSIDFLAYRHSEAIRVRVTSRLEIKRPFIEKDLHLSFPVHGRWYLISHDDLLKIASETTPWLLSPSWQDKGLYSSHRPSQATLARLDPFGL